MTQASDIHVQARDLVQCGMCVKGQQRWFEQHGFDFRDFLKNGISSAEVLATGDGMAIRAIGMVRERRGSE